VEPWFGGKEHNPWPTLLVLTGINIYVFCKWNEKGVLEVEVPLAAFKSLDE
jgi:hypothetical protein